MSAAEVQDWLKTHNGGQWLKYAARFEGLTGQQMSGLSEEAFLRFADSPYGSAIYNDWRALAGQAAAASNDYHAWPAQVRAAKDVQFTINGAIDRLKRDSFFYVDPAEMNEAVLLPAVRAGKFVMLHGPRASGKSTRMLRACEQLSSEFYVMDFTMQDGIQMTSAEAFWSSVGDKLRGTWQQLPDVRNSLDFTKLFDAANQEALFAGKRVVLVVDEFDMLEHAAPGVHDEVLHTLRGLKQSSGKNCLHSLVGVGPFSILKLNTERSGSPFNASDAVAVDLFREAQVSDLFTQLQRARRARVDERIAVDVHRRTDGHPGLVGWCGKMVDERLLRGSGGTEVTLDQWEAWAAQDLVDEIVGWQTMGKMIEVLKNARADGDVDAARQLLTSQLLPYPALVRVPRSLARHAEFLVAEGALRKGVGPLDFAVRNDLVRSVLLAHILPLERRTPPVEPFPLLPDGAIDVPAMLNGAVVAFSRDVMAAAGHWSSKWYQAKTGGRRVPHEFSYHFELVHVLQSWAPRGVLIGCEVKGAWSETRADIVLELGGKRLVLELLASCTLHGKGGLQEHCDRASKYRATLGAHAAVVIHFVAAWPPEDDAVAAPALADGVSLVTVYHDTGFRQVAVVAHDGH